MKNKYCLLFLPVAILFSLASCQPADTPARDTDTTVAQEATAETTAAETVPAETVPETTAPVLDGSFSTPDYEVKVIDGKCYLNFTDGNEAETNSDSSNGGNMSTIFDDFIRFDSLTEMKQKLVNNQLTDEQKNIIKAKFALSENGFEICNVQELIQPVVPADLSLASVYLYGDEYSFSLIENTSTPQMSAIVNFGSTSKWEQYYQKCMDVIERNQLDSHETGTFDGASCEIYIYTTNTAQIKEVYLTLPATEQNASTHIVLTYVLQLNSNLLPVSDTVPLDIHLFGEKNDIHFDYLIQGLTEAPTVEWLSSFSIAPYVDNSDHVVS